MNVKFSFARTATIGLMALALAGCATHYDRRANNTLLGAGLGAATGAVFSGGDPIYALAGAAAGGVLGNVLTEDRRHRAPSGGWERGRNYQPARAYGHDRNYYRSDDRYDGYRR